MELSVGTGPARELVFWRSHCGRCHEAQILCPALALSLGQFTGNIDVPAADSRAIPVA
jgi:hypothetical protein